MGPSADACKSRGYHTRPVKGEPCRVCGERYHFNTKDGLYVHRSIWNKNYPLGCPLIILASADARALKDFFPSISSRCCHKPQSASLPK